MKIKTDKRLIHNFCHTTLLADIFIFLEKFLLQNLHNKVSKLKKINVHVRCIVTMKRESNQLF